MHGGKGSCLQKDVLCPVFITSGPLPGPPVHSPYQNLLTNPQPIPFFKIKRAGGNSVSFCFQPRVFADTQQTKIKWATFALKRSRKK